MLADCEVHLRYREVCFARLAIAKDDGSELVGMAEAEAKAKLAVGKVVSGKVVDTWESDTVSLDGMEDEDGTEEETRW